MKPKEKAIKYLIQYPEFKNLPSDILERALDIAMEEGSKNLSKEYEKLLMMLQDKFPEAFKYYKDRLRPL